MAAVQKAFLGQKVQGLSLRNSRTERCAVRPVASSGKIDITKQGMNSVPEGTIKQNLMGRSRFMKDKDWKDSQGRKGKGYGVYRFEDKYGVNVDGYSPIWTPDSWSEGGDTYKLGAKGLIAWAGLITVLLSVGATLIYSTSQLAN